MADYDKLQSTPHDVLGSLPGILVDAGRPMEVGPEDEGDEKLNHKNSTHSTAGQEVRTIITLAGTGITWKG